MARIDHGGLLPDLDGDPREVGGSLPEGVAARVATCEEQELLDQLLHVLALDLERRDGLIEHVTIGLPPTVQHVHVALDDGDGGAQLVACVVHEAHLLQLGLLHLPQQPVEGHLDAREILVARDDPGRLDRRPLYGLLEALHLAGIDDACVAQLLGPQRQVVQGGHRAPHAPRVIQATQKGEGLGHEHHDVEGPGVEHVGTQRKATLPPAGRRNDVRDAAQVTWDGGGAAHAYRGARRRAIPVHEGALGQGPVVAM